MKYIEPVLVPDQATRRIDRGDEFGDFVGPAVIVCVAKAEDTSTVFVAPEGAAPVAGYIKVASGRGGDIDGIVGGLPGSVEGELKAFGYFYASKHFGFFFGRELDNGGLDIP